MKRGLLFFCMAFCCFTAMAQLNGTYTINQNLGTSGTNYKYFAHAILALQQSGVSGPVVFDVVRGSGPYVEQIKIDSVAGATATNTVTFRGNGEILTYAPFNPIKRHIIRLSGAKHIIFEDLIIKVDDAATYGWCVQFKNDCDSIRFSDCVVVSKSDSNKSTYVCFAGNSNDSDLLEEEIGPAVQNLTIYNCVMLFGSYSVFNSGYHFYQNVNLYPVNNRIEYSLLNKYSHCGISLRSNASPLIDRNYFTSNFAKYFAEFGVLLKQGELGYNVSDNYFMMSGRDAIYSILFNNYTQTNQPENIVNNFIGGIHYTEDTVQNGIFIGSCANTNILNNSVLNVNGKNSYGIQIRSIQSHPVNIFNNILYCASDVNKNYPLHVPVVDFEDTLLQIDYNNYHSDDSVIYYWHGQEYTLMDTIRSLYDGNLNHNSISVPPGFFSPTNLHTNSPDLDSAAYPILSIVSTDIDGEQRHGGFPDIGADEYTYDPNNPYCSSYGFTTRLRHIEQVCVGSGCFTSGDNGGYGDYTHISGKFNRGGTYAITLTPDGGGNLPWPMVWRAWIDLNRDGDFKDSLELVFSDMSKDLNPATGSITIPSNAATGPTRLRIQMGDSLYNECDIIALGETEDYSIILSEPYCSTGAQSSATAWIDQFCVNATCVASGNNGGYRLVNTAQNLSAGNSFSVVLTPGFSGTPIPVYWRVFLDTNRDGDYVDAGETLFSSGPSTSVVNSTFSIPPDAYNGRTRLRFVMSTDTISPLCNTVIDGEVEDFNIGIVGGQNLRMGLGENEEPVGIDGINPNSGSDYSRIAIWPNPATDRLYIDVGSLEVQQVRVMDMMGNRIAIISPVRDSNTLVDVSDWPSGVYSIELVGKGLKDVRKVVVQ